MFSYHEELDKKFYLPVINKRKLNHNFDNNLMSKEFFIKYNILFNLISQLKLMLNSGLLNNIVLSDSNSFEYIFSLNKLKKNIKQLSTMDKESIYNFNAADLELHLLLWGENLDLLYSLNLYKIDFDEYLKTMRLFNDALIDIGYKRKKLVELQLSNTWFITSKGYLYNTRSSMHSGANFNHYYDEFKLKFLNGEIKFESKKNNSNKINPLPEIGNSNIITDNGYVRDAILDVYLHYTDYVEFNKKSFDPKFLKIITGMIEIESDYIHFLEKLHKYTKDPVDELNKLIDLTGDNYEDVLIRCCGASKVTNSPSRTIVTSSLNYDHDFEQYIINGWNMSFVPPIIIDKSKGIIEEYPEYFIKTNEFRKRY